MVEDLLQVNYSMECAKLRGLRALVGLVGSCLRGFRALRGLFVGL